MTKSRTNADNVTADIAGITAGTGITGGGTSGTVTITNDMATTIAAKGDLLAGTANDAYSAITVGANDTVLVADSAEATGLKWATPSSGGMTLLSTTTLSGTTTTISSIDQTYKNLLVWIIGSTSASTYNLRVNPNASSGNSPCAGTSVTSGTAAAAKSDHIEPYGGDATSTFASNAAAILFNNYSASERHPINFFGDNNGGSSKNMGGIFNSASAITSLAITTTAGTASFTGGTVYVYGVK